MIKSFEIPQIRFVSVSGLPVPEGIVNFTFHAAGLEPTLFYPMNFNKRNGQYDKPGIGFIIKITPRAPQNPQS